MKIIAYNKTKSYNLDKYSAQSGDTVQLKTNVPSHKIKKITWYLSNGVTSHKKTVDHVFKSNHNLPGEGYFTVKVKLIDNFNKVHWICRRLFIATPIDCRIFFQKHQITDETISFDLLGEVQCAQLVLGNPLEGARADYACGGACQDSCPQFNILVEQLQGTHITEYGRHRITTNAGVDGQGSNDTCIELYKDNILSTAARYPPIVADICVVPENLELVVASDKKSVTIQGLSMHMFPKRGQIHWKLVHNGETIHRASGASKTLLWRFDKPIEEYVIKVRICIPKCPTTKVGLPPVV